MLIAVAILATVLIGAHDTGAQSSCPTGPSTAEVISVEGAVLLTRGDAPGRAPQRGEALCPGDQIVTGDASAIDIRFAARSSVTNILSSSTVIIPLGDQADIRLESGLMRFLSSVSGVFRVSTPRTDAGIDGTEALVTVDGPMLDTLILVREGVVDVSDVASGAGFSLQAGEASYASTQVQLVRATPDNVPAKFRQYLLNPEGAADWAVYYPPILLSTDTDPQIERAAALLDAGQPDQAEGLLAAYQGPDQAAALAVRALAAIFRNQQADGAALAEQALAADPNSAPAQIATSYVKQAAGDLPAARDAARAAVAAAPSDAYAWARLAELELTLDNRTAGLNAADRSLELAETSLGHAVKGFASLAANDPGGAEASFERAIDIDSGAPLPRLGLGLARIKQGDLAAGRADLEIAASLDPQRASLRGWLGRAYLEEGLTPKAAAQFQLAQEQDPDDPSAWLFSAEERFLANDPLGALTALQEAEARADGRITLRGRAGLGEDQAVRDTATGRVFDVLGFESQAAQAGSRAVSTDPTNPGAHRFLADVYRAKPGFEIAVSSELLVAQLLSPPSKSPVQPRLSEPDLGLQADSGTSRVSFNEFAPLFDGDGFYVIGSAGAGTQATFENELSLSLLSGNVSLAVGQFHSQTAGFRPNDDVRHTVVSVESKIAVTDWLTLTGELRMRETIEGDRFLRSFNAPTTIRQETQEERVQLTIGGHAELSSSNDLLFFGVAAETDVLNETRFVDPFMVPIPGSDESETRSFGGEIQDIQRFDFGGIRGNLIAGIAGSTADTSTDIGPAPFLFEGANVQQISGYLYANAEVGEWLELTVGVSVDHADRTDRIAGFDPFFNPAVLVIDRDFTQVSPKAGIRIEPINGVVIRGAYARTLKRELVQDRTLEPTTIAGFNQLFDDLPQTDAQMIGGGVDIQLFDNLWIGGEAVFRDLETPQLDFNPLTFNFDVPVQRQGEEMIYRGYVNMIFGDNWSGSIGVEYSKNESQIPDRPDIVETLLVPVSLNYFDESGIFGGVEAIFFDQSSVGQVDAGIDGLLNIDTSEQGVVLNATIGYRLPNGRGVMSLEVLNILDQSFSLQNALNNSGRPGTRPLAEGISVMGRVTFGL